jgi:hypothetical protein
MGWNVKYLKLQCECGEAVSILVHTPEAKIE